MKKEKAREIVEGLKDKSTAWNQVVSSMEEKCGIWYEKYRNVKYQFELAMFYLSYAIKW